jgi:hypothetical protein
MRFYPSYLRRIREPFAQDCGWPGPPFGWDEDRRFLLRCELDAAFFHLYLGSVDEWGKASGDDLAESIATSPPYQTLLNPPPADPRCCHPSKIVRL